MKKSSIITIVIAAIVVIVGLYAWTTYNGLVTAKVAADTQWKQVETDYQRRFDLIPGLVNSVKGSMKQEQQVFNAIAEARTRYSGATTPDAQAAAASQVESAVGRLLVITENYPQLKSSDAVQSLMIDFTGSENRISVERARFNKAIQAYNLKVMRFPSSIFASMFGFSERQYFSAVVGAEIVPVINF